MPIRHVVIVVQENRSFDNLFHGFPGADTVDAGWGHGTRYPLVERPLLWRWDPYHAHAAFVEDFDGGKNDGFDRQIQSFKHDRACRGERWINLPSCWTFWPGRAAGAMTYSYVAKADVAPYWTMAARYALADRTFASNGSSSYGSHQFMIAGQSAHVQEVNNPPWGCDSSPDNFTYVLRYARNPVPPSTGATGWQARGPFPCFEYRTAADILDAAGETWRYYLPQESDLGHYLNAFDAIRNVRFGPGYANVRSPEVSIFHDIAHQKLANVSWVVPSWPNSDHAGPSAGDAGPDWVASIVNAIGESRYWNDTAIVVLWDDWGGWYDHVPPPQYADPQTGAYEGLGFRVPLIVISPYAKPHYVSHQQHEVASTLHFIETVFGLPALGTADVRADDLGDMLDVTQKPQPFRHIPTRRDARWFVAHPSALPADTE